MSRNLCRTDCQRCSGPITLDEDPRLVTKEETGVYFAEYRGMLVANAECAWCKARYLAWLTRPQRWPGVGNSESRGVWEPIDLSFRSTFNDEPGPDDLPEATIVFERGQLYPR